MSLVLLLKAVGYAAMATVNCYFYRMMGSSSSGGCGGKDKLNPTIKSKDQINPFTVKILAIPATTCPFLTVLSGGAKWFSSCFQDLIEVMGKKYHRVFIFFKKVPWDAF